MTFDGFAASDEPQTEQEIASPLLLESHVGHFITIFYSSPTSSPATFKNFFCKQVGLYKNSAFYRD
jgi:hypothetical protein